MRSDRTEAILHYVASGLIIVLSCCTIILAKHNFSLREQRQEWQRREAICHANLFDAYEKLHHLKGN